jgi:PAS domain S-box-containing protein
MTLVPKMIVSLLVAALLLTVGISLTFWSVQQIKTSSEARKHTSLVIRAADDVLFELKDAETGQRGYLLTGDEAFLQPYLLVRDGLRGRLENLRQLTSIDTARKTLDEVVPLMNAKMAEMAQVIDLHQKHNDAAVTGIVSNGHGKAFMDAIQIRMSHFVKIEESMLTQREAEFESNMRLLFVVTVLFSLLVLLAAISFAFLIYRQARQQLQNQFHLETLHLLETQEAMNQQLQQTNLGLQVSEEQLAVTLNSIGDAVISTDAKACVTSLNPLAEQLTGWTREQAIGRQIDDIFQIINKNSRQPVAIPVMNALSHGTVQGLANHTVLLARDGNEYDIADSCAPIRCRDGEVIGAVLVFRNVTAEYAVQQKANDSAALLQAILDAVSDGIITLHANGSLIETVNPAIETMFGYDHAEIIGKTFDLLIPDWVLFNSEQTIDCGREVTGRRKDGSLFALEIALNEMQLGGQRHFTGIVRDLTIRKEAEEALLKAGALQKAIFDSANFSSIATDANGVIQIFNVGAERMLGYTAAEVMNQRTPADISDPQEIIIRAKTLSKELDTNITPGFEALVFKASRGIEDIYELTYIRKDGSRLPAVVSVTALRDDEGTIIGYLLIGTDNTARKQIEEERKKLDQRLRDYQFYTRSLFECNIDAIMTTDSSGIITDANKQMESLTGCARDELIGAPFKQYFTDPVRAEAAIHLALVEKKVTDYELTARTREGLETVVSYNATTFYDRDGNLQGVFAAARDITERKRLDLVLEEKNIALEAASALADKANLAKSDFLSSMSHELRSPLNAILGFAQVMASELPAPIESQQSSIDQILRAGWHLLKLINEILDLAKIESRQVPMSKEPVLLDEIFQECRGMFDLQVQRLGIQLIFPPVGMALFVYADRTRLKQVFINLLSNAIKYNTDHGSVEVSCVHSSQNHIRVSIRDTGIGMSPLQQSQLFQAFNRLGQDVGSVEGTGIGLVVAKQLVELMDGNIGVESSVGKGSVFWFELPSVAAPVVGIESSVKTLELSAAPVPTQVHTLLYVEDNQANMKLVEKIMGRYPSIRLLTAINGETGIALARESLPDVILLDINLPGINGFEILKLLRKDPVTMHIPALAISANAMPSDIKKGKEAGFLRYITKPIKVDEFMDAINAALKLTEENRP